MWLLLSEPILGEYPLAGLTSWYSQRVDYTAFATMRAGAVSSDIAFTTGCFVNPSLASQTLSRYFEVSHRYEGNVQRTLVGYIIPPGYSPGFWVLYLSSLYASVPASFDRNLPYEELAFSLAYGRTGVTPWAFKLNLLGLYYDGIIRGNASFGFSLLFVPPSLPGFAGAFVLDGVGYGTTAYLRIAGGYYAFKYLMPAFEVVASTSSYPVPSLSLLFVPFSFINFSISYALDYSDLLNGFSFGLAGSSFSQRTEYRLALAVSSLFSFPKFSFSFSLLF